jgi:hypothetical protein
MNLNHKNSVVKNGKTKQVDGSNNNQTTTDASSSKAVRK